MDKTDRTERKKHANAGAAVRIVIWLLVLCLLGGLQSLNLLKESEVLKAEHNNRLLQHRH